MDQNTNELEQKLECYETVFLTQRLLTTTDSNAFEAFQTALAVAKLIYADELDVALRQERKRLKEISRKREQGYKDAQMKKILQNVTNNENDMRIVLEHRSKLLETKRFFQRLWIFG